KLLLLYAPDYWLRPFEKNLPEAPDAAGELQAQNAIVALIHAEEKDQADAGSVVTKAIKNLKWLARKFDTTQVVLHSFAHLSSSKAEPVFAEQLLQQMAGRLRSVGFTVVTTPFGYFHEFRVHVAGPSLAKVFVEI
ncbi:MAG: threonyl-tRNA synthetase editing domain-containing protein, partial [bacterium]